MNTRAAIVGGLVLLAPGCGPGGPGDSDSGTGAATESGSVATGDATGTGTDATGGTTGTPTTATTDVPTTDASTTGTTSTTGASTTDGTTGAPTCEAIVGSEDCEQLVMVSPDLTLEECQTCQGATCGQIEQCDNHYPCVGGKIVLRGCCVDSECEGLTPFCGMFIGTNNICVLDDDQ